MHRYIIEREMPGAGKMSADDLRHAAQTSNAALARMAPRAQWENSYVTADKIVCVYLADDEDAVREHARLSGFPATAIAEVSRVIDPMTAVA